MNLKRVIQGFLVGVGKIIPGVSGSMLAIFMGIYEPLMEAVTRFFDDKKKHFNLLFYFGIGLFLAIVLFSKIILFLLENYYDITIYLFLGLITGTVFQFKKQVVFNRKNKIIFLFAFFVLSIFPFFDVEGTFVFQNSIIHYLYLILLGGIDAFTSIVPGISGTAIFMMLGSYEFVLSVLANPFSILFLSFLSSAGGTVFTCYLMYYLFQKWKNETQVVILAFSLSSLLMIFLNVCSSISFFLILIFVIGMVIGYLFDR